MSDEFRYRLVNRISGRVCFAATPRLSWLRAQWHAMEGKPVRFQLKVQWSKNGGPWTDMTPWEKRIWFLAQKQETVYERMEIGG